MSDLHVEALFYRVNHAEDVDYEKAPPLRYQGAGFSVRIADGTAQIDMIDHHATSEAARAAVEPFLRAWELSAALQQGPGEFQFVYDSARVIDRDPPAGPVQAASVLESARLTASAAAHVCRANYPPAPLDLARDAAVDLMFDRYCMYREHRTMLADAANYCLTVLETAAGGRSPAARRYVIAQKVLGKIATLAATKGGSNARKAVGAAVDFTAAEHQWLEQAMSLIIRRAAEVAFDPKATRPQITMTDLRPL